MEKITFGSGCFWCSEAIFQRVEGVVDVRSGYAGGHVVNPTYPEVCTGDTGHAEVVEVTFDPLLVTFEELLGIFWKTHDPTTLNRQGNDVGTQYRSVIFYHTKAQQQLAEAYRDRLTQAAIWENPIVTEISPISDFFAAESYHQDYFNQNQKQPYCNFVVVPKVEKFKALFPEKLKKTQ
ncbi:MAG: peptide-methionine (S)-S-oxide reductase MsrA [Cyclobacteriaceae bacterium]|nr:peptide-methionine (S)-S-oxide reductase MsrA [Cyclobacteriaceae bacterium]